MIIRQEPYSGEKWQPAMAEIAHACPSANIHTIDLPYRLSSWGLDNPENVGLWVDDSGSLLAWAVMQTPFWSIDITCHPDIDNDLYGTILSWADDRARQIIGTPGGRPAWFVNVFASQTGRMRQLEAAGFANQASVGEDSWSKVWMQRPANLLVNSYRIPPGFVIRPLRGRAEVNVYVELHQQTFESRNMTASWRLRTLHQPDYHPELDLVVAAPDGRLAAFCVCWLTQDLNGEVAGQVEPLGCHPDFRHYALGRVALAEGLRRLQACGVQQIFVETDNYRNTPLALYESVGFRVLQDIWVYRKDYAD